MTKKILVALATTAFFTSFIFVGSLSTEQPTPNSHIVKEKTVVNKEIDLEEKPLTVVLKTNKKIHGVKAVKKIESINILVSFYTNNYEDCGKTDAISASGKNLVTASRGGNMTYVAAPKSIAFGTMIEIEGIGTCNVQDRGGAIKYVWIDGIKYMKIDIFVPGATSKQLKNKGLVKTKGHIITETK